MDIGREIKFFKINHVLFTFFKTLHQIQPMIFHRYPWISCLDEVLYFNVFTCFYKSNFEVLICTFETLIFNLNNHLDSKIWIGWSKTEINWHRKLFHLSSEKLQSIKSLTKPSKSLFVLSLNSRTSNVLLRPVKTDVSLSSALQGFQDIHPPDIQQTDAHPPNIQ